MTTLLDPRDHSPDEYFRLAATRGLPASMARKLLAKVVDGGKNSPDEWVRPSLFTKEFAQQFSSLPALTLISAPISARDNFQKLLFHTNDGLPVESVIIPLQKQGKVTLCLSSQVGCVMGCAFCATGRMESQRSLATWEIADQFIQARRVAQASGRDVTGVVFMGMGEPFLNYSRVIAAAKIFSYPLAHAVSAKAITISTVGMIKEIERFTHERHPFRLSISIGAASDEKRKILMPLAARTPIKEVMAAARKHAVSRRDRVMIAYVCISKFNMFEEDATALAALIGETPVRLDLIEVNDATKRFLPPGEEEMNSFRDALTHHLGQPVVRRYSGGADINAACGTLAGIHQESVAFS